METTKRNTAIDILRIIASFSVVMLHSAAQYWYDIPVHSVQWTISNAYDSLVRFGVPIFVMISGALFLGRNGEVSIKKLLTHNALRMIILYAVWSCIYGLMDCASFEMSELSIQDYIREIVSGRYHLWFLPMIAGLYVISPLISRIVKNADEMLLRYCVVLFVIFQILRSTLESLTTNVYALSLLNRFELPLICSYAGYYILGYYLVKYPLTGRIRTALRILVIPAAISNIVVSTLQSRALDFPNAEFYDCFGIGTFIITVGIFVEVLDFFGRKELNESTERVITEISYCTLGIYLMHIGVQELLAYIGLNSAMLPLVLGIPVWAILNFTICMALAAVIRRIPVVGRYIC